jgi:hypothetical protein
LYNIVALADRVQIGAAANESDSVTRRPASLGPEARFVIHGMLEDSMNEMLKMGSKLERSMSAIKAEQRTFMENFAASSSEQRGRSRSRTEGDRGDAARADANFGETK